MLTPVSSGVTVFSRPRSAALFTRPQPEPTDTVEVRPSQCQTLWKEVDRLGIWTSLAGVTPPLGSVLSVAAQDELKTLMSHPRLKFGFSLDPSSPRMARTPWDSAEAADSLLTWDDPQGRFDRLNYVAEKADFAPVNNFRQLQALEAMVVTGDLTPLENASLARRLLDFESSGAHLQMLHRDETTVRRGTYRELGAYGAYQAFPEKRMLLNGVPLQNERDLETAEFFLRDRPDRALEADVRARTLRELQREGFDFLRGSEREPVDALAAYRYGVVDSAGDVQVCLEGLAPEKLLAGGDKLHPVSARMRELMDFARQKFGDVAPREGRDYLQALVLPGELALTDRWEILTQLRASERSSGSMLFAFEQLLAATAPGEKTADLVPEYVDLRARGLGLDKAGEALHYFHRTLPSLTFGPDDFRTERAALVELAEMTGSLPEAVRARTQLTAPGAEPYAERLAALAQVKTNENYAALAAGQLPLAASAKALLRLEGDREAFVYLARGVRREAFPDLDSAVDRYLQERSVAREPGLARELCRSTEPLADRQEASSILATPEDFRVVWEGPHENLVGDARALASLHELLPEAPDTARGLFRKYRGERVEDVRRELELISDLELMERSVHGDFGSSYDERAGARQLVGEDYPLLLRQHRAEAQLAEEARALGALRGALPGPEGLQVYQFLQERLRAHPEENVGTLAQGFLRDYLVTNDLQGSLGRVGQKVDHSSSGVGQHGDSVVVGGVRLPRKE